MAVTTRPLIRGRRCIVASGHYLATAAGFRIVEQGGNAIDAAAAMSFCLNLLEPQSNGLGGEVPILIHSANDRQVYAVSGVGHTPQAFTIDWCRRNDVDLIPGDGFLPATVPAPVGTWGVALARFGTMSYAQVLAPALELAANGYPVYAGLTDALQAKAEFFKAHYPSTAAIYLPGGRVPQPGEFLSNPDFAKTLTTLCQAESTAGGSREKKLLAAVDAFYRSDIAKRIEEFVHQHPVIDSSGKAHAGLMTAEDMATWHARVERPVALNYRDLDLHKCHGWTQGAVFLQQLSILEGYDLAALGHNSPGYLHCLTETAKLAFADREAYYGDPDFDRPVLNLLLDESYGAQRRARIGDDASAEFVAGDIGVDLQIHDLHNVRRDNRIALGLDPDTPLVMRDPEAVRRDNLTAMGQAGDEPHTGDTTHLDAIDHHGNMVAATPSGGWIGTSPIVPGLGFALGTRGQMFYLNANRPNALAGHKRPRATLTPTLVTSRGRPWMVFGTPGGDAQDQWTLQFFLNHLEFGMDIQTALDAATIHCTHFPSSFYPRAAEPKTIHAESRIEPAALKELEERGHIVTVGGDFVHGKPMGIRIDVDTGMIWGGVSPKGQIGYALGW